MHTLTMVLPALHWPHTDAALPVLATPGLNALRRQGRWQMHEYRHSSALLSAYVWHDSLMRLARRHLRLPEHQPAFWCSPLHQHIGMHSAHILSGATLAIQSTEATAWCADLSRFFTNDGWHFHPWRPDLWLVTCPAEPQWQANALMDLPGQLDAADKPQGPGSTALLQAQTEMQMLLHSHPLNHARQQHGQMPVNGVWCWRDLPGRADAAALLVSDSMWAANADGQTCPTARDWPALQQLKQTHIGSAAITLFDDALLAPVQQGDAHTYAQQLHDWDARWFTPLHTALTAGSLQQLFIVSEGGTLHVRKPRFTPFWRRRADFAGQWQ